MMMQVAEKSGPRVRVTLQDAEDRKKSRCYTVYEATIEKLDRVIREAIEREARGESTAAA